MPSVLEQFFILFSSNADEIEESTERAGKATDKLEEKVEDTGKETERLNKAFLKISREAQSAIIGVLGFGAVTAGLLNAARQADEVGKFSETLGINVQELGAWSEAVIRSGGTAEGFRSTVSSLTNQITDFVLTGGGAAAEVFARLGINAFDAGGNIRSAFDVLPELADAFSQLTQAEAVGFGQRLGLDQGTILLLQQGRREVDELVRRQRELGVVTEEDAKIAADFNDAWADFSQRVSRNIRELGAIVLPVFTRILNSVDEFVLFLKRNQTIIEGFFIGAGLAITIGYLPAITKAAIATGIAIRPFLLIGTAIAAVGTAFALVYEDIQAFRSGQDSLIGTILEKYPQMQGVIDVLRDTFNTLFEVGEKVFDIFTKLFNLDFSGAFGGVVDLLKGLGESVSESFTLGADVEAIRDAVSSSLQDFGGLLGIGQQSIEEMENTPLASMQPGAISNRSTSNRTTNISVGSIPVDARGGDASDVARNVGSEMGNQFRQVISDFDDGLVA